MPSEDGEYPLVISLLGSFHVKVCGQHLPPLRTRKGEWLLALLSLRRGSVVTREWLAGQLWPDSTDGAALYNLRRCLSDLRHAMGSQGWRLQSPTPRTISLELSGAFLDVEQFDAAASRSEMQALETAVSIYRGYLLEGCDEGWIIQERAPREENYLATLELLAAKLIASGSTGVGIAYLRRAVARNPARETAQRALMSALAQSGEHAEVLHVYQAMRQYLRSELNTDPAPETQNLVRLLRDRIRLPLPPTMEPKVETRAHSVVSLRDEARQYIAEPVGGAVPLTSPFYTERYADGAFCQAVLRQDSIVLVKGSRQVGKTSLLSRGLQVARQAGRKVVVTNFQKLTAAQLDTIGSLLLALSSQLADRLDLDTPPEAVWRGNVGANENFERYIRRVVLRPETSGEQTKLVWGLDEIDLLFSRPYGSEFFALLRSWHNERALDPDGPWARLTLCIAYTTEAHLFITDPNQSPFNVGTRLNLDDFNTEQVKDLAERYGDVLPTPEDRQRFQALTGGHPYLVRRGLYEIATRGGGLDRLETIATRDDGPFGEHLRRLLLLLTQDAVLGRAVKTLLRDGGRPDMECFYRLRSAGVITGETCEEAHIRCGLYVTHFGRELR